MSALKTTWYFPDMFYPSSTPLNGYVSHEALCVINPHEQDCEINITLYYEDRDPIKDIKTVCGANRTKHIRMDQVVDSRGNHIVQEIGYAAIVKTSLPVVVQYTRVDTSQNNLALMTNLGAGE